MGTQILKRQGGGKTGVDVDRCDAYSMTSFFDNTDLVCHMFKFINVKEDRSNVTLVCKGWNQLSIIFPHWRKVNLRIDPERACIAHMGDGKYSIPVSVFKDILTRHKGLVWFHVECRYMSTTWWADLATFMPHVVYLSLTVSCETVLKGSPVLRDGLFRLAELPSLLRLDIDGDMLSHLTSLSLELPALQTLRLGENHKSSEIEILAFDIQCPCLLELEMSMWTEMPALRSSFANLQSLELIFFGIPKAMVRENGGDLVLNGCPQLKSLFLTLEIEGDATLFFDYPSLKELILCDSFSILNCNFRCPKLIDIHLEGCWFALPTSLMPQLKRILCYNSRLIDEDEDEDEDEDTTSVTLQYPSLEVLELMNFKEADSIIVNCVRLREFSLINCETESCTLKCPSLSELVITDCPLLALTWKLNPPSQKDS